MSPFVALVTTAIRVRTVAVWLAVTAATVGVGLLLGPALLAGPGRTFVDVLTWGCAVTGLVAAGVAWGVVTDVARVVLAGTPAPRRRLGPLRTMALVACGVAALGSPAAAAGSGASGEATSAEAEERRALSGLPLPDRPGTDGATVGRAAAAVRPGTVTVQPGDHLWGIARAHLGPDASVATLARHVHELHRRNAAVIGPDPDLILPGQRLVLPPPPGRDHR